jgi:transcriptional repressor NrdR
MQCPFCLNSDTKVIDKRDVDGYVKRRRECLKCSKRYNTHERAERANIRVVKRDGTRESFDYDKVKRGVVMSCEKRPISTEKIEKMLFNIEAKLRKRGKEVGTDYIGDLVSRELRKLDKVAYIRFASVYKDFTELDDFKKEIKVIQR